MNESSIAVTGSCLCGKVRYSTTLKGGASACHCRMCRRWSSGPYMAVNSQENVKFEGAENIVNYASSEWAERGFCRKCGSNLYYHLLPRPEVPDGMYMLAAGTVEKLRAAMGQRQSSRDATLSELSVVGRMSGAFSAVAGYLYN